MALMAKTVLAKTNGIGELTVKYTMALYGITAQTALLAQLHLLEIGYQERVALVVLELPVLMVMAKLVASLAHITQPPLTQKLIHQPH